MPTGMENGQASVGSLGADLELTEAFLRMGIDELSVSPSMVLKIRKAVRESDLSAEREEQ